jgi:hypothetical protein
MELLGEYRGLVEEATDLADVFPLGKDPKQAEAIARKLDAKPGLRDRLERKADQMLERFERDVFQGKYDLDLFSTEEIMLAVQCLEERLGAMPKGTETPDPKQIAATLGECMRQAVSAFATPERIRKLAADLQTTGLAWLRKGKPEGAIMQIESKWLADDPSPDQPVIYSLFAGQIRRLAKTQRTKSGR